MIFPGQERRAIVTTAASSTARDSLNLLRNPSRYYVCKSNRLNRHTFSIKGASGEAVQTRLLEHPESLEKEASVGQHVVTPRLYGTGSGRDRFAGPDFVGCLDHLLKLTPLRVLCELVAMHGRGKSALRRYAELGNV